MKLYLIRHAECGHNVGQGQASGNARNANLTEDGKTQVGLLSRYYRDHGVRFTHVFSSDLDRASDTAQGICRQQLGGGLLVPFQTSLLKEQAFGSLEGTRWQSGAPASNPGTPNVLGGGEPPYTERESVASMKSRATTFLDNHILPLMGDVSSNAEVVAVVAHGIILQVLWTCLTELLDPRDIHLGPGVSQSDFGEYAQPSWSNSGYMELDLKSLPPAPPLMRDSGRSRPSARPTKPSDSSVPLSGRAMTVMSVDNTSHLAGAQQVPRAGGTVRNPVHGSRQQAVDDFYRLTGAA